MVEEKVEENNPNFLEEYKARAMSMLNNIVEQLKEKYPDNTERIEYLRDAIIRRLSYLSSSSLYEYEKIIYLCYLEYKEFAQLMPDLKTVDRILSSR